MWNRVFPMLYRHPAPPGNPDAPEAGADELAKLVQEAFPLPAASDALRARVNRVCRESLAPGGRPDRANLGTKGRRRWRVEFLPAHRARVALAGTVAGLCFLSFCSTRYGGPGAAMAAPTPGQLAIVDDRGHTVGLCPLKHTDVSAEVAGYAARVTVRQEFHNPSDQPIEAVYTFPLPEDAAVDDMTMILGDNRVVRGEIKRRQEAREIYEAARDAGQAAALLDQERPNLFTQSVANIMPGERVSISIRYVNLLKYEAGRYEFVFPMVVGPRYIPGSGGYQAPGLRGEPSSIRQFPGDPGTEGVVTDAERITPPVTLPGTRAGHNISLQVKLDAGMPLGAIHSELHPIDVRRADRSQAVIRLREERTLPNKDFILQFEVAGPQLQTGVLAQAAPDGTGHFTLIVQPPAAAAEPRPKEIVFVIDESGSQSGWPIRKAKETMSYLIRNMNPGDTFQLLGFNTEINACFERPVGNSPANVARALRFLRPIEGNGGTDILQAVDYALRLAPDHNRRRIICYLTDGYVGDDMQILAYIRKHRGQAHMFPFGIGDSPNRFLIEGMAKEGHGTAEFVTLNSSAEAAAARFYRRISQPLLTGIGVDWNGLPIEEVYPSPIPDLFVSGRPIVLKGRFTSPAEGHLFLHGRLGGRPWRQAVPVSLGPASNDGEALAALWAREKIEDLQSRDWLGQQTGNSDAAIVEQIVDVALQYRLMSQHTSFVAVEQRVVNLFGKPRFVDVPLELPEGMAYESIFGVQTPVNWDGSAEVPVPHWYYPPSWTNPFQPNRELSEVLTTIPNPVAQTPAEPPLKSSAMTNTHPLNGFIYQYSQDHDEPIRSSSAPPVSTPTLVAPFGESGTQTGVDESEVVAGMIGATQGVARSKKRATVPDGRWNGDRYGAKPAPQRNEPAPATQAQFFDLTRSQEGRKPAVGVGAKKSPKTVTPAREKLEISLQALVRRNGPPPAKLPPGVEVVGGRVAIQVWVDRMPADGLKKLRSAGFESVAALRPGQVLLGTVKVDDLERLASLSFVLFIEPPKLR